MRIITDASDDEYCHLCGHPFAEGEHGIILEEDDARYDVFGSAGTVFCLIPTMCDNPKPLGKVEIS